MTTPTTAVERFREVIDGDLFVLPYGTTRVTGQLANDRFYAVGKAIKPLDVEKVFKKLLKQELSRCRRETLIEVEGLELMQDKYVDEGHIERMKPVVTESTANLLENQLRSDLRTQLTLLKGKK